jgi:hypothetical protein
MSCGARRLPMEPEGQLWLHGICCGSRGSDGGGRGSAVLEAEDQLCWRQRISCAGGRGSAVMEAEDQLCWRQRISCAGGRGSAALEAEDQLCWRQRISCKAVWGKCNTCQELTRYCSAGQSQQVGRSAVVSTEAYSVAVAVSTAAQMLQQYQRQHICLADATVLSSSLVNNCRTSSSCSFCLVGFLQRWRPRQLCKNVAAIVKMLFAKTVVLSVTYLKAARLVRTGTLILSNYWYFPLKFTSHNDIPCSQSDVVLNFIRFC